MDATAIARRIVLQRRMPKISELYDLCFMLVLPRAVRDRRIASHEIEDELLSFLMEYGFHLGKIPQERKSDNTYVYEKIAEFAMQWLQAKGPGKEGSPYKVAYLRRLGPIKVHGRTRTLYATTQDAQDLVIRMRTAKDSVPGELLPPIDEEWIALEGPAENKRSAKYYKRDSTIRELVLSRMETPVCCICERNMEEAYGENGWEALDIHHLDAIAQRSAISPTYRDRILVLCCTCHAVHHRAAMPLSELYQQLSARDVERAETGARSSRDGDEAAGRAWSPSRSADDAP